MLDTIGKVFAKIIANWCEKPVSTISPYQFGFRKHRSPNQAILAARSLLQRRLENNQPLVITFIDLRKAFDSVDREVLYRSLKRLRLPDDLIKVITELHQTPVGKLGKDNTFQVGRGVRQGCVLGPTMFIIILDYLLGLSRPTISHTAYADDLALFSADREEATEAISKMSEIFDKAQLEISIEKIEAMCVVERSVTEGGEGGTSSATPVHVKGCAPKETDSFEYLGSVISKDGNCERAIAHRISKARMATLRLRPALVSHSLSLATKALLIEVFLKPVLLYALDTLVMKASDVKRLEAVMHREKRMSLRIECRSDMKLEVLNEKVKTLAISLQLNSRRIRLYASYANLSVDALDDLLKNGNIWQKDWQKDWSAEARSCQPWPKNQGTARCLAGEAIC